MGSANWISAKEAARKLGYAPEYVARLCRQGSLEARRDGSTWSIREESLHSFAARIEQQQALRAKTLSRQFKKETKVAPPAPAPAAAPAAAAPRPLWAALALSLMLGSAVLASSATLSGQKAPELAAALARVESPFFAPTFGSIAEALAKMAQVLAPKRVAEVPTPARSVPTAPAVSAPATTTKSLVTTITNTYPIVERTVERIVASSSDLSAFVTYDFLGSQISRLHDTIADHGSGGGGTLTDFSSLTASDIPDLSATYLKLTGGTLSGLLTAPYASTTAISGTTAQFATASSTSLIISGITSGSTQCLQVNSSGTVSGTGSACGSGSGNSFDYPFPSNATTTLIAFSGGLTSASTTLTGPFVFQNATGTNATTTSFAITGIASSLLSTNAQGSVVATSSLSISQYLTGTLGVAQGGTGSTTLSGLLVGNGTSAVQTATVSSPLSFSGTTLSIAQAAAGQSGYLTSTDWSTFDNKISSTSLSGGAGISYNSSTGVITNTIAYPFPSNATTTLIAFSGGLTAFASSTIGNGTAGLTISGNATTTGDAYFAGNSEQVGYIYSSPTANANRIIFNNSGPTNWLSIATRGTATNSYLDFGYTSSVTAASGVPVLSVGDNGRAGVGSTTPYAKLSVHANNGSTDTTLFAIGSSTASATTTHFAVTNAGYVGIGTTTPWQALSVSGSSVITGNMYLGATTPATSDLHSVWNQLRIGLTSNLIGENGAGGINGTSLVDNAYIKTSLGDFAYTTTAAAARIRLDAGITSFQYAGSGTAGNAVTFSTAMTIDNAGYVGIGNTTPSNTLTVGATDGQSTALISARSNNNAFEFGHSNTGGYGSTLGHQSSAGNPFLAFNSEAGTNTNTFRTRGLAGSVFESNLAGGFIWGVVSNTNADNQTLTNTMTLSSGGALAVTSCTGCSSDERLKQNIQSLSSGDEVLAQLRLLRPVAYNWRDRAMDLDVSTSTLHYGFIAQEAQTAFPDLVYKDVATQYTPDGTYLFNYQGLIAPLVLAVQALDIRTIGLSTTTPQDLVEGPFEAASDAFKAAVVSALEAVGDIASTSVRTLGKAVYASVAMFDQVLTQKLTAKVVYADEGNIKNVHTGRLCITDDSGETCVTKGQLDALLRAQPADSPAGANNSGREDAQDPPALSEPPAEPEAQPQAPDPAANEGSAPQEDAAETPSAPDTAPAQESAPDTQTAQEEDEPAEPAEN